MSETAYFEQFVGDSLVTVHEPKWAVCYYGQQEFFDTFAEAEKRRSEIDPMLYPRIYSVMKLEDLVV